MGALTQLYAGTSPDGKDLNGKVGSIPDWTFLDAHNIDDLFFLPSASDPVGKDR